MGGGIHRGSCDKPLAHKGASKVELQKKSIVLTRSEKLDGVDVTKRNPGGAGEEEKTTSGLLALTSMVVSEAYCHNLCKLSFSSSVF